MREYNLYIRTPKMVKKKINYFIFENIKSVTEFKSTWIKAGIGFDNPQEHRDLNIHTTFYCNTCILYLLN
jgi:hypothetical protein